MKFGIRELFFVILLLAIPAGAQFWVFKPASDHMEKQRKEIEVKEAKLVNLQKAMVGIKDLNEEVDKLKAAVAFFENKLPPRHEIHKVLKKFTEIAENHGLETKLFETLKEEPFAGYSEQPIQMQVNGDFAAFYQFLLEVEKMPRITKIKAMELERDTNNVGAMDATFTVSIYFDNRERSS
jgi:type IV pilus assembly protein PilO